MPQGLELCVIHKRTALRCSEPFPGVSEKEGRLGRRETLDLAEECGQDSVQPHYSPWHGSCGGPDPPGLSGQSPEVQHPHLQAQRGGQGACLLKSSVVEQEGGRKGALESESLGSGSGSGPLHAVCPSSGPCPLCASICSSAKWVIEETLRSVREAHAQGTIR